MSLESRNCISKQIPRVQKDDGSFINDQFKILNETTLFYENLRQNVYRKTENIYTEYFLLRLTNSNVTKLTHDDSNSLESTLINSEVYNFL